MSVYQNLSLEQVGQSIANNTSKVRIKWTSQQTGSSYNNAPGDKAYYYITINGGTRTEHTVAFTLPQNTTKTILDTTLTVNHKADGTGSIKVETWMDTEISAGVITQTKTLTLDTIPRASAVSAPSTGTLGTALKITIDRKSANFSDKLYYKIGSNSAVQITEYNGTAGNYSWTPPVSLATNAPNSTKLAVTLIVNTYNGTAYVGRSECTVTLAIPASEVPTLSVSVTDPTGNKTKYTGYFLQLRSKIKVAITAAGVQGSTIKSYSIKVGNFYTSNASSGTTGYLPNSGTLAITCTVTDSRGRSASQSQNITVLAYTKPTISAISAARCNQDGSANRAGTYGKVTFSASITPLTEINTAAYTVQYREVGTESWTTAGSAAAGDYSPADVAVIFAAEKTKRFEVRVVATDTFESIGSSIRDLPAAYALFHLAKHLISVGIGRLCDKLNAFQVGLDAYFDKNVQVDGTLKAGTLETVGAATFGGNVSGEWLSGTWLRSTAHSDLGATPESYPVFSDGWIYSRTLAEMRADLAAYETVPLTVVSERLTDLNYTARYYPMLGMCFVRIYGKINADLNTGYDYNLLNIGARTPANNTALAVKCGKDVMAIAQYNGVISLRPMGENIAASDGWDVYISGFWFA